MFFVRRVGLQICIFTFCFRWYNSLPPISKGYGTLCLLVTTVTQLGILHPYYLALIYGRVFKSLEVGRSHVSSIFSFLKLIPLSFRCCILIVPLLSPLSLLCQLYLIFVKKIQCMFGCYGCAEGLTKLQ